MNLRIILLSMAIVASYSIFAQKIIPINELDIEMIYEPQSLAGAELDSVYNFAYWGNNYDGSEVEDSLFNYKMLLGCRNLQKLSLHNVWIDSLYFYLDKFPYLQVLELVSTGQNEFPTSIKKLGYLQELMLDNLTWGEAMDEPWPNKIRKLAFDHIDSECTPEGESCTINFGAFSRLEDLSFYHSNLTQLAGLQNCKHLKSLSLASLDNIHTLELSGYDSLKFFGVSDCSSEDFRLVGLEKLLQLEELQLSGCGVEVDFQQLENLKNLKILNVNGLGLKNAESVGKLVGLENLDISACGLGTLPASLSNCTELQQLYASSNDLQEMPKAIYKLSKLRNIELNYNHIHTLTAGISALKKLENLSMNYCDLETIEPAAFELPELQNLMISGNLFKHLPEEIGHLTKLYNLYISNDSLKEIPASLFRLKDLTYLDAGNNFITEFNIDLSGAQNLYMFNLENNSIKKIGSGVYAAPKLSDLNIVNNKITSLPKGIQNMQNIYRLRISGNQGIKYPKGLEKCKKLEFVELNSNDVKPKDLLVWKKMLDKKLILN
jgi:Leucine-rich repeat (LRR) protein